MTRQQGHWKIAMSRLVVLILAFSSQYINATAHDTGDAFAHIGYNPYPVARYVAGTSAWKEGRRNVLDWGSGGGRLSQVLARKGAHQVVALDMNANATNAARQNLEPFSNAMAKRTRLRLFGPPGQLGYISHFDIVVSLCGALSDGTVLKSRIKTGPAMKQAVHACREGGSVIVGEVIPAKHYKEVFGLVLASAFGWNFTAEWLWNRPEWLRYFLWFWMSLPMLGAYTSIRMIILMKNIARSFLLREWRPSSIIFISLWFLRDFLRPLLAENMYVKHKMKAMRDAGLVDLKHRSSFMLYAAEPVQGSKAPFGAKLASFLFSLVFFPIARVWIFEGVRKKRDTQAP